MKKILITAFNSFNGKDINYSKEVLKYLKFENKYILDVCYDLCFFDLTKKYNLEDFDLIIALGEARSRKELTLEVNAKNIASCSISDNRGIYKKDNLIISYGLEVLETKVNVNLISDLIELSYDAGKYVCNNLYYYLLHFYPNKALFIHVPECENSNTNYKKYADIIKKIINRLEGDLC